MWELQRGHRGPGRGGQTSQIEIRLRRHNDGFPLESHNGDHAVPVHSRRSRRERQMFRECLWEVQDGEAPHFGGRFGKFRFR